MKYINFVVGAVGWVQYFIPLVIEGNKRNIKSNFFMRQNPKDYADPYGNNHLGQIKQIVKKYNINIFPMSDILKFEGLTFFAAFTIMT